MDRGTQRCDRGSVAVRRFDHDREPISRDLAERHEELRLGWLIGPVLAVRRDDADDGEMRRRGILASGKHPADPDSLLPHNFFTAFSVDDSNGRRSVAILLIEVAPFHQAHLHLREVSR